jgi:hypothetical protein
MTVALYTFLDGKRQVVEGICILTSEYPKHTQKVLAINGKFSIISQWDASPKRLLPAGALAITTH